MSLSTATHKQFRIEFSEVDGRIQMTLLRTDGRPFVMNAETPNIRPLVPAATFPDVGSVEEGTELAVALIDSNVIG